MRDEGGRREVTEPEGAGPGPTRVSLLPTVVRRALLSALLGGGAFVAVTTLSPGLAQVQGYRPTYALPAGPFTYLDLRSLQAELRRAGVGVSGPPTRPVLTFPNTSRPVVVETGEGRGSPT